jgi:hypothetical protein
MIRHVCYKEKLSFPAVPVYWQSAYLEKRANAGPLSRSGEVMRCDPPAGEIAAFLHGKLSLSLFL